MAALTKERNTRLSLVLERAPRSFLVKGGVKIWKGSQVALNAGYLAPFTAATGLVCCGRAQKTVDNTAGADGAVECEALEGDFKWDNDGTNPVVAANIGALCYGVDDHTVGNLVTGKSIAGRISRLESDGVWVCTVLAIQ